eukprot:495051_1
MSEERTVRRIHVAGGYPFSCSDPPIHTHTSPYIYSHRIGACSTGTCDFGLALQSIPFLHSRRDSPFCTISSVNLGLLLLAVSISFVSVMVALYCSMEIASGIGLCCVCYFGFALQAIAAIPSTHSHLRTIWMPVFTSIASHYWHHNITSILMRYLKLLLYPP